MFLIANIIVLISWVTMILWWVISAFNVKKNVKGSASWGGAFGLRLIIIVVLVWVLQAGVLGPYLRAHHGFFMTTAGMQASGVAVTVAIVGAILCAAGVAFAIWARVYLGRNWSGVPSIKEGHELVTSGPYRFVRHPIYTGIILACFGTTLVEGIIWAVFFVAFTIAFLFRIPKEEGYMMQLFSDQYPEYKKRTKALIPFVW